MTDSDFRISPSQAKQYLDDCIRHWRKIEKDKSQDKNQIAKYYIDAYQSVRMSLFGELLPLPSKDE